MYKVLVKVLRVLLWPFFRVKVYGKENFPKEGEGCIVAFNHKSCFDPITAALATPRELNFMAKKELFENKLFAWLIKSLNAFPIDRGTSDIKAIKTALTILKNDDVLLIFPEGKRVKEGLQTDDDAKNGITLLAHRAKKPVVPALIVGKYKLFVTTKVVFGEPVYLDEYYNQKLNSDTMHKISTDILNKIRNLCPNDKKTLAK